MAEFVRIAQRWEYDGMEVWIGDETPDVTVFNGPGGGSGSVRRRCNEFIDVREEVPPTLRISRRHALVLLRELDRVFGGTEDTRQLRKDYDAERARVDALTGAVVRIATNREL
jgi:hypothetical protein